MAESDRLTSTKAWLFLLFFAANYQPLRFVFACKKNNAATSGFGVLVCDIASHKITIEGKFCQLN
jgi:hypothetical protein